MPPSSRLSLRDRKFDLREEDHSGLDAGTRWRAGDVSVLARSAVFGDTKRIEERRSFGGHERLEEDAADTKSIMHELGNGLYLCGRRLLVPRACIGHEDVGLYRP